MAAKNNITNDSLISKPFSSAYADGWDKIYLKTPKEWYDICDQDPQDLDFSDKFWGTSITAKEFQKLFETNENQNNN